MPFKPLAAQKRAIEASVGPTLVVAGPGAGKTFCLINRVGHLIEAEGFDPHRILAVTFTNKAAEEIAFRLRDSLGRRAEDVHRGTMHALCAEILREHGSHVKLKRGFGIADDVLQLALLRRLGVRHTGRARQLMNIFSRHRLQGQGLSPDDETLFLRYRAQLLRRNLADFDDLIVSTGELLVNFSDVADEVASKWDCILVDEFQDLNMAQYRVLKSLARSHRHVFAVGDEEQSIFSWAGAEPEILRQFQQDFEIAEPIVLDSNRRTSKQIFQVARRLLRENPSLFEKNLTAERDSQFEVKAYSFSDDGAEAGWIVEDILRDRTRNGELQWGDYAVLYRRHDVGGRLEQFFVGKGIPCRLARGRALADDPVVRYVAAALRLMGSGSDELALDGFADIVLPEAMLDQVRALHESEQDLVAALRKFASKRPKADPDAKRAWRFIYQVENFEAMYSQHEKLGTLVEDLLTSRVGKYGNVLEEHAGDISDPADDARALALAETLADASRRNARIAVRSGGGLEIGILGLLSAAGYSTTLSAPSGESAGGSEVVLDTVSEPGLPLRLFKALQFVHGKDFPEAFDSFVAFDLETTDSDIDSCETIEIGAVKVKGGEIVEEFHRLVKPTRKVSKGAAAVHGYNDEDLVDASSFEDVWPEFVRFVDGLVLVAHNGIGFDVPVLKRQAAELEGVDGLTFFDTLPLARSLYEGGAKLGDLAERFGVDTGRAHHALDDSVTLAQVMQGLIRDKVKRSRKTILVNLLDYLALSMALENRGKGATEEEKLFFSLSRVYALGRFSECLDFYAKERERSGATDSPELDEVVKRLGGKELMEKLRTKKGAAERYPQAMERLEALIDASRGETLEQQRADLLENVALSTSNGAEVDDRRINLLTLHATKGLEFSRVYIVGLEDYQVPGYHAVKSNREKEIEESRRLLYVGMTRAEDRLVMTRVDRRNGLPAGGSRFLDEMGISAKVVDS